METHTAQDRRATSRPVHIRYPPRMALTLSCGPLSWARRVLLGSVLSLAACTDETAQRTQPSETARGSAPAGATSRVADPRFSPTPDTLRLGPGRPAGTITRFVEVYLDPAQPMPASLAELMADPIVTSLPVAVLAYWMPASIEEGAVRLCRPGRRLPPIPPRTDCSPAELDAARGRLDAMARRWSVIRRTAQMDSVPPPVVISADVEARGLRGWALDRVVPAVLRDEVIGALGVLSPPPVSPAPIPRP